MANPSSRSTVIVAPVWRGDRRAAARFGLRFEWPRSGREPAAGPYGKDFADA